MTRLHIKRRKQLIGLLTELKVITQEGNVVSLKAGETAILTTDFPEEVLVKKFFRTKRISTGITTCSECPPTSLELFYNLPDAVVVVFFIISFMILFLISREIFWHTRPTKGIWPLLFIIFIPLLTQRSLTLQKI